MKLKLRRRRSPSDVALLGMLNRERCLKANIGAGTAAKLVRRGWAAERSIDSGMYAGQLELVLTASGLGEARRLHDAKPCHEIVCLRCDELRAVHPG